MKSWSARLLAARRVTQDNQGKKTAGVDGRKSLTPDQRLALVNTLRLNHKTQPVRRVWIPNPATDEKRPLGIPTIFDRALQALVNMALKPQWEARRIRNSNGILHRRLGSPPPGARRAHGASRAPSAPRPPRRSAPQHGGARPRAAWTGRAGWGRIAPQGRPGAQASGRAVAKRNNLRDTGAGRLQPPDLPRLDRHQQRAERAFRSRRDQFGEQGDRVRDQPGGFCHPRLLFRLTPGAP